MERKESTIHTPLDPNPSDQALIDEIAKALSDNDESILTETPPIGDIPAIFEWKNTPLSEGVAKTIAAAHNGYFGHWACIKH